jgi:hypothetical protein
MNRNTACSGLLIVLAFATSATSGGHAGSGMPTLRYDKPEGFSVASGVEADTWISDHLDGVIQVYQFRPFHGDFQDEFRRALFRDSISPPYREDRLLAQPTFKVLPVRGADAAMTASFKNFNGGASREHLRVAVLSAGFVALVDISANSPQAFQRNQPSVVRLLNSLQVVDGDGSSPRRATTATAPP